MSTQMTRQIPIKFNPGAGEIVYEYFINNYLVHWYQGKSVTVSVYIRAIQELCIIKNKRTEKTQKKGNTLFELEPEKEQEEDRYPAKTPRPKSSQSYYFEGQTAVTTKDAERNIDRLKQEIKELNESLTKAYAELNKKNTLLRRMNDGYRNCRDEVNDLKTRLGDKNPNLSDLSDANRPTELGRRFSEIYDIEWSDALESIPKKTEDERIWILHEVVMSSYHYCDEIFRRQVPEISGILLQENQQLSMKTELKTIKTENIENNLKALRKRLAPLTAENVAKNFVEERLGRLLKGFKLSDIHGLMMKYAGKCAEICWFMIVCDPPMVISEAKEGMELNTDVYRPYTRSVKDVKNPVVEFNVWPALFLHYKGPKVAKGVAQPKAS